MATGRVFSNLKYMQMPRYLESQQYEELITENEHLHGIQKQFESSIVKQKIPIQFILNKPNVSGFLIEYIAKREDGNVCCNILICWQKSMTYWKGVKNYNGEKMTNQKMN